MPLFGPDQIAQYAQQAALSQEAPSLQALRAEDGPGKLYRAGQIASIAGPAFDALTTLHGWYLGDAEQNGLIGNDPKKLLLIKGLSSAARLGLMKILESTGHPKIAGAMGLGATAPEVAAGIRNIRRPWAQED